MGVFDRFEARLIAYFTDLFDAFMPQWRDALESSVGTIGSLTPAHMVPWFFALLGECAGIAAASQPNYENRAVLYPVLNGAMLVAVGYSQFHTHKALPSRYDDSDDDDDDDNNAGLKLRKQFGIAVITLGAYIMLNLVFGTMIVSHPMLLMRCQDQSTGSCATAFVAVLLSMAACLVWLLFLVIIVGAFVWDHRRLRRELESDSDVSLDELEPRGRN